MPYELVQALLLAGLLIAVWEFEASVVRPRKPHWSLAMLAFAGPVALAAVALWGNIVVPFGLFAAVLIAAWYLIPSAPWQWVGSAGAVASAFLNQVLRSGWSAHAVLTAVFLIVLTAVLRLVMHVERRARLMFYFSVLAMVLALALMSFNKDPVHDIVLTLAASFLLAAYVLGRVEREHLWRRDVYRAEHDALTDALTRYGLQTWLDGLPPSSPQTGIVIAADLDDFKWFNDSWGHDVGDQVLQQFAHRVRSQLRLEDGS